MHKRDVILEIPALLGVKRGFLSIKIIDEKPFDAKSGIEIKVRYRSVMHNKDSKSSICELSNGASVSARDWIWK